ncbi:Predicted arabinose efflux permease, MFS family [Microbacterium sp. cf046]|uniref:MFS transporter n=1 Tax=Microbacterium sp. cf046 TaxID=1761803 RepID=UPI0008EBE5D2|nr:MFS transporter [Microbacterium sp. cf046]SFR89680.1 Predicted arabinose efflux permease, MFS family [Microbacterium sp. cf046]
MSARGRSALDSGTRQMLWRFAPMIYGPTLLFGLGEGALLPLLPVVAASLGADVPQAAFIAAALVVARLVGNLPAGWLVARIGERYTMAIAGALALAGSLGVIFAPTLALLAVSVFGIGLCASAFGLARHAFMTTRVPLNYRARALSVLGGSFRLGMFAGPFVAAAMLAVWDDERAVAWFFAACLVALILLVLVGRDPEEELASAGLTPPRDAPVRIEDDIADDTGEATTGSIPTAERQGVFRTMWRYRGVLARLGLPAATLSALRQARVYLLPLWGLSLGLDAQTIALVVGITGALEFGLFYSSGQIMDRWGRLWAALPSMVLMGAAFLGLAFTHDLPAAFGWFIAVAVVVGIGNGLSSGILMTLGADVAPPADPAAFLGSWRTLTDAGGAAAPLLIAAITAASTLSAATAVIGVIGLLGAVGFAVTIPRYVPHPRPSGG